jgi:hypothetical protein
MMENVKKLEFPEGQEGVRGNQGFPLIKYIINIYTNSLINENRIIQTFFYFG